ncbi:hypothetical protein LCGC14_0485090 [marine sediment metagenome]|uniref:Uncharacterized protein n=1 Tax=marine sediment metagenome TaxID=412755 RepID=A0A0F9UVD1_9ZZZZ
MRVKIRITGDQKNKEKGFYLLMIDGDTYSNKLWEFVIDERSLEVLNKNKIGYVVVKEK